MSAPLVFTDPPDLEEEELPDTLNVSASITVPKGLTHHALLCLPLGGPSATVAASLLSCARSVAHGYSPMVSALLEDQLAAAAMPKPSGGLTVGLVDSMASGGVGLIRIPGIPEAVPVGVVRAILVAGGAW